MGGAGEDVEYVVGPETRQLPSGAVVAYKVIRVPDSEAYPSGWKYSLHLHDADGNTVLRYDNAHEDIKGHERHTGDGPDEVECIEFPGMDALYERFRREVNQYERTQTDESER